MEKTNNRLAVNLGLFVGGVAIVFTGMLIQLRYHIGNHGHIAVSNDVWGIAYNGWSALHKVSIVVFSLLMVYHVSQHLKWYKVVIQKRLMAKNQQVLVLSILFVLVAITGLTPWGINLLQGDQTTRKILIEIHDKLAIILAVYLLLHVAGRIKWFLHAFRKNQAKQSM